MHDSDQLLSALASLEQHLQESCQQFDSVREGISRTNTELQTLRDTVRDLRHRRDSLEAQVMQMAQEQQPPPNWWEKVIILYDEHDDDDPEPTQLVAGS